MGNCFSHALATLGVCLFLILPIGKKKDANFFP